MSNRYRVSVTADGKAIVLDSANGREAEVEGLRYGEMPIAFAQFKADILNWLDSSPPLDPAVWPSCAKRRKMDRIR